MVGVVNPSRLSRKARWYWNEYEPLLAAQNCLTPSDVRALVLLCEAHVEYDELGKLIAEEGYTYATTSTTGARVLKGNPAVAMMSDAWKRIVSLQDRFGLTPSARSRVRIAPAPEPDESEFEKWRRKGGAKGEAK
jgi:P27 family predicted phage terminase small subunit